MKITRLERTVVCVPFVRGILSTPDYEEFTPSYPEPISRRNQDVLKVFTNEGLVGIGMSSPYFGRRELPHQNLIGRHIEEFEPRALGGSGYSIALLDLIGKAIGWPVCRIFGGKFQDKILVDYWIQRMGIEDSADAARRAAELGFHGIKMKCTIDDLNVADRVHAMHEAAPALRIVLDPGHRFHTVEQSLELAREIESYDIVFEDPIPKDSWEDYRRLKEETSIIIAPHLQNPQQVIEAVHHKAVDGINVAPSDWGFLDMARIAESAGVPVWNASNVDLGVHDAYRMHASAAAPNCTLGSDLCGNFVHEHSLLSEPLVKDGYAVLTEKPGLGVELDEDAVQKYKVESFVIK
ncbi:MAG: mandelate racemase/muconate lactonizing enzyme family protein [Planctomycetota bacterium]|nr:mandelate racemase/muconate lactonizing enzyme family protein [Planctomycetota bacterium]MDA1141554.1 mandelate racemase/muconate lactonizing enzyme family protein [Planctomycetota bacterium]